MKAGDREKGIRYAVFLAFLLILLGVTSALRGLLLAPAFAATAYLAVFTPDTPYTRPLGIVLSYLVVVGSTEAFELVFGVTFLALVLNVVLVSLFITFSPFSHVPAIALTIFSYLVHDPYAFAVTSLVMTGVVAVEAFAIERVPAVRRRLGLPDR